jgi:ABC-type glutathione transport system ATPase component
VEHQAGILEALGELNRRYGTTLLVVTHDPVVAHALGDT